MRLRRGGGFGFELELRFEFADVLEFGQRGEFVQALEPEVIEEHLGGAEQGRLAGDVAVADDADPLALLERLDDVAVHRDAADLLDLAARDRLAIGDQRERFQRGAGVLRLPLGPQARDPRMHVGLHLEAEARGEFDEFDAAVFALLAQGFQRLLHAAVRRRVVQREQPVQLRERQRLVGRHQRGFDDAVDQRLFHGHQAFGSFAAGSSSNSLESCRASGDSSPTARDFT